MRRIRSSPGLAFAFLLGSVPTAGAQTGDGSDGVVDRLDELQSSLEEGLAPDGRIDPASAMARAAEARTEVFARPGYRFCHDPRYGENGTLGVDFCPLFDEATAAACPEAAKSCPSWTWPEGVEGEDRQRRVLEAFRPPSLSAPRIPRSFAQLLLLTAAVALVALLVRALGRARWSRTKTEIAELPTELEALAELPEAPAKTILREARASLASGDAPRTALLLHLALLRHLDDGGLIRFHPSRTNGEYARALRAHPELQALFRGVASQVERLRFGDGRVDPVRVERLLEEAEARTRPAPRSSASPAPLLVLVGASALAVPAGGCDRLPDGTAFYFRGPTGLSALPEILEAAGVPGEIVASDLEELNGLGVVVLRTAALDEDALDLGDGPLGAILESGTDVVLLDDGWHAAQVLPLTPTWAAGSTPVERVVPADPSDADECATVLAPALEALAAKTVLVPAARRLRPRADPNVELRELLAVDAGGGPAPIALYAHRLEGEEGAVREGGTLYVFADRDLFTNASLTRPDNAAFAAGFFASLLREDEWVSFVDQAESYGTSGEGEGGPEAPNAGRILRASKLLPFLLQLFVLLFVLAGLLGAAFGPLRDPKPRRRKSFAGHADALGRLYDRAGPAGRRHAARALARWLLHVHRDRIRHRAGLARELAEARGLDEEDVAAALALGHAPEEGEAPSPKVLAALDRLVSGSAHDPRTEKKTK